MRMTMPKLLSLSGSHHCQVCRNTNPSAVLYSSLPLLPGQDASLGMRRAKSLRKKMNEVDTFATARGLPEELRHALCSYFNDAWMAHEGMHSSLIHLAVPAVTPVHPFCRQEG